MVAAITLEQKKIYASEPSLCLSGLNPEFYQRAVDRGNVTLLPHEWSNWSDYYRPQAIAGTELLGKWQINELQSASFVLRVPKDWNGMLVSAATPATRNAFSLDIVFSDVVLARGFAYLASDKGTPGQEQANDPFAVVKNALIKPGAMDLWHQSFDVLTAWAQQFLFLEKTHKNTKPLGDTVSYSIDTSLRTEAARAVKTYAVGLSNGGYVVRKALETGSSSQGLFAGGLDVEGVSWQAENNLISTMRDFIVGYTNLQEASTPKAKQTFRRELIAAGLPDCPEILWDFYFEYYWFIVFNIYRDYFDPGYPQALSWPQYFELDASGKRTKDHDAALTNYVWQERLGHLKLPLQLLNTGELTAPLISVCGSWDCLTVPKHHSKSYASLVEQCGKAELHRNIVVEKGTHIDGLVHSMWDPEKELQPLLPEALRQFDELLAWA